MTAELETLEGRMSAATATDWLPLLKKAIERASHHGTGPSAQFSIQASIQSSIPILDSILGAHLGPAQAIAHASPMRIPVGTEPSRLPPLTLKLRARPELLVDTSEVVRRLKDPKVQRAIAASNADIKAGRTRPAEDLLTVLKKEDTRKRAAKRRQK